MKIFRLCKNQVFSLKSVLFFLENINQTIYLSLLEKKKIKETQYLTNSWVN